MHESAQIIIAALSNPSRLDALTILYETPMCASDITYLLEMSQSAAAHHLRILRRAGLLRREHRGVLAVYELSDARTRQFAHGLTDLLR